jgi:hypothetical protein
VECGESHPGICSFVFCLTLFHFEDGIIIITSRNPTHFTNSANTFFQDINKWFTTDLLSLNVDKTQYMQFVTETSSLIELHVMYKNKEIANTSNSKFLVLTLDSTFSWKNHIDIIVPKLSSACFAVRAVNPILSQESFMINNRQHFKINSGIHIINTRNNLDLHYPQSHLSADQKGAHYTGIKVFNRLPVPIKQLFHDKTM